MSDTHTPAIRPPAFARWLVGGEHVASAVYGSVIAIAVIGAWYADPTSGALETLASMLATLVVFWIAHTYAHVVGQGLPVQARATAQVGAALRHDWPIVQAGLLPTLALALGAIEAIDERLSMRLAIAAGVVALACISTIMARAAGRTWFAALRLAATLVVLGASVAILEIMLG